MIGLSIYMSRNSCVFTTAKNNTVTLTVIYMSRNSRVFTTAAVGARQHLVIYMSRNSRVFTTIFRIITVR